MVLRSKVDPVHDIACPHSGVSYKSVMCGDEILEIRYKRGRWERLDFEGEVVTQKKTAAWVFLKDQHVGSIAICEFRVDPFASSEEFFQEMDDHSSDCYRLASAVCENWPSPEEIWLSGDIMEIRRIWMHPSWSDGKRMRSVLKSFVSALSRNVALLIAHAFPLEYENEVSEVNSHAFQRRRRALHSYYVKHFGLRTLSSKGEDESWMYKFHPRFTTYTTPLDPNPIPR